MTPRDLINEIDRHLDLVQKAILTAELTLRESETFDTDALEVRLLSGRPLTGPQKAHLKRSGKLFEGLHLARQRMFLQYPLTDEDKRLLWASDGIYPYDGDLDEEEGDLTLKEARKKLNAAQRKKQREASKNGPPKKTYDLAWGPVSTSPTLPLQPLTTAQPTSGGSFDDPLSAITDPVERARIAKALAIGDLLLLEEKATESRRHTEEVAQEQHHRERLAQREKQAQLAGDGVFTSAAAVRPQRDTAFRSAHEGEFDAYNTGAEAVLLQGRAPSTTAAPRKNNTIVGLDDKVSTTVKTRRLSPAERAATVLASEGGQLLRQPGGGDAEVADSTGLLPLLTSDQKGSLERETWIRDKDGKIRVAGQMALTKGRDEYHVAMDALFQKKGRYFPLTLEEAEEYGFPAEMVVAHHSTLSDGEEILGGGEIELREGKVERITNSSGHYRPDAESTFRAVDALDKMGGVRRSVNGTTVDVFTGKNDQHQRPTREVFRAVSVLAAGDDFARAEEMERLFDGAETPAVAGLTPKQQAIFDTHQAALGNERGRIQAHILDQIAQQKRAADNWKAMRADLEQLKDADKHRQEWQRLDGRWQAARQEHARLKTDLINAMADYEAHIAEMTTDLQDAQIDPEVLKAILWRQAHVTSQGWFSVAQKDLAAWMASLADRRHELDALRADDDYHKRRAAAAAVVEKNLARRAARRKQEG